MSPGFGCAGLDIGTAVFNALDGLLVGLHLQQRLVDLGDDGLGCLGRREDAVPLHHVNTVHARFLERGHVGQGSRQHAQATVVTVDTTGDALRAVAQGKADAYVGALLEAVDWFTREPVPGVEVNQLVSDGTGFYHFGLRKDWAPLAGILNKGIQCLRDRMEDDLAALAMLPTGASVQRMLALSPAEADLLARMPVWRVGAVRGLRAHAVGPAQ